MQITSHAFVAFSMQVFLSSGIASSHVVDSWNVSGMRSSLFECLAMLCLATRFFLNFPKVARFEIHVEVVVFARANFAF